MRTTTQTLPGVTFIGWLDCEQLPRRVDLHGITRTPVPVLTAVTAVEFFDTPECSCVTEREGRGSKDTATLSFLCGELLPLHRRLGFAVTDAQGRTWLIGQKEPPFPRVKVETLCGQPDGDPAGYRYEVEHCSLKSLVACLI